MQISPYLNFSGNCKEAFAFYEKALDGKITMSMTFGESPMADQCGPEAKDWIMHTRMDVAGQTIMGSDAPPQFQTTPGGFAVSVSPDTIEEAERIFAALAEGATVDMPLQETFWAARFGMLKDKFGIPWMINCESRN